MNLYRLPRRERTGKSFLRQSQGGQIVVEYVLLLAVAVGLAVMVTKTLIGRDEGNEGFIISAWESVLEQLGTDPADDISATQK